MANTELGNKFKETREAKGLTYYRVSKDTGLTIQVIHRLEAGGGHSSSIITLAKYLGVSLTD